MQQAKKSTAISAATFVAGRRAERAAPAIAYEACGNFGRINMLWFSVGLDVNGPKKAERASGKLQPQRRLRRDAVTLRCRLRGRMMRKYKRLE